MLAKVVMGGGEGEGWISGGDLGQEKCLHRWCPRSQSWRRHRRHQAGFGNGYFDPNKLNDSRDLTIKPKDFKDPVLVPRLPTAWVLSPWESLKTRGRRSPRLVDTPLEFWVKWNSLLKLGQSICIVGNCLHRDFYDPLFIIYAQRTCRCIFSHVNKPASGRHFPTVIWVSSWSILFDLLLNKEYLVFNLSFFFPVSP